MLTLVAQASQPAGPVASNDVVLMAGVLTAVVAVPFLLAVGTSFLKLVVVGHILRNALGTPGVPPTIVITGLAIVLSAHIMTPTARESYTALELARANIDADAMLTAPALRTQAAAAAGPLRTFLTRHAHASELALFARLRTALEDGRSVTTLPATQPTSAPSTAAEDWTILVPAFVISELSEAFQIGFVLFVPFLIIDLVVSSVLVSMGMFMLNPVTVTLPIKLLLFVLVDGWTVITQGLVLGYT